MNLRYKILAGPIVLVVILIMIDQSRSFYCLSNKQCITVWKRLGNRCYVIPGRYYGVLSPTDTYIKTSNTQRLTLYFSKNLPNKIISRNQGSPEGNGEYNFKSNQLTTWKILPYSEQYKSVLYKPSARRFVEVRAHTNYIDLNIEENYAVDKSGKKFK